MKKEHRRYEQFFKKDFFASHIILPQPVNPRPHIHSHLEILLSCSDNLLCRLDQETISVPKHHMMLLNHGDLHWFYMEKPTGYERYVFCFSPGFLTSLSCPGVNLLDCFYLRPQNRLTPLPIPQDALADVLSLADKLLYYANADPSNVYGTRLYQKAYLTQFLLKTNQFYRDYHHLDLLSNKDFAEKDMIYEMIDYIHVHYREPLTVDTLSARFFISKTRLYEVFPLITGDSPGNYILKFRLSKAKELLAAGYSVELTGQECGFPNLSHFSKIFKQHCGISPKQYQISSFPS